MESFKVKKVLVKFYSGQNVINFFFLLIGVKVSEPIAPNLSCPPKGLVDIGLCKFGAPLSLSWPHFYKADKKIREGVEGEKKL